jgi:hypothetical protein
MSGAQPYDLESLHERKAGSRCNESMIEKALRMQVQTRTQAQLRPIPRPSKMLMLWSGSRPPGSPAARDAAKILQDHASLQTHMLLHVCLRVRLLDVREQGIFEASCMLAVRDSCMILILEHTHWHVRRTQVQQQQQMLQQLQGELAQHQKLQQEKEITQQQRLQKQQLQLQEMLSGQQQQQHQTLLGRLGVSTSAGAPVATGDEKSQSVKMVTQSLVKLLQLIAGSSPNPAASNCAGLLHDGSAARTGSLGLQATLATKLRLAVCLRACVRLEWVSSVGGE